MHSKHCFFAALLIIACDRGGRGHAAAVAVDAAPSPALTFADPTPPQPWTVGPREAHADIGSAEVEGGVVANAERVVAGMKAGVRACYNRGLTSNPEVHGRVHVVTKVDSNGNVMNALVETTGNVPDEVTMCLQRRVMNATFAPPEPSGAEAKISFIITLSLGERGRDFR